MTEAEVIGVYPVDAAEPCHLVEILLKDNDAPVDIGAFTQPTTGRSTSDWQVPWDEKVLSPAGDQVLLDLWHDGGEPGDWQGDVRVAFFMHHLDFEVPLSTPFGELRLPTPTPRPERLGGLVYEAP